MATARDHARASKLRRDLYELAHFLAGPTDPDELEQRLRELHPRARELPERELRAIAEFVANPMRE